MFKSGRSQRGARAAMSHTGFFGGSHRVCQGAFRQAGIIETDSIEELVATAKALALQPEARGPRAAMISNGAGTMIQAIDLLDQYGLTLPEISPETIEGLKATYPPYYIVHNPVDVTGSASSEDYRAGIAALVDDPNVDLIMPWFVFQDTPLDEGIVEALSALSHSSPKPILCGAMGGPYTADIAQAIEAQGVPVFGTVREWLAAAKALSYRARGE